MRSNQSFFFSPLGNDLVWWSFLPFLGLAWSTFLPVLDGAVGIDTLSNETRITPKSPSCPLFFRRDFVCVHQDFQTPSFPVIICARFLQKSIGFPLFLSYYDSPAYQPGAFYRDTVDP